MAAPRYDVLRSTLAGSPHKAATTALLVPLSMISFPQRIAAIASEGTKATTASENHLFIQPTITYPQATGNPRYRSQS